MIYCCYHDSIMQGWPHPLHLCGEEPFIAILHIMDMQDAFILRHTHFHNTQTCQIIIQVDTPVVAITSVVTHHYPQVTVRGLPHGTNMYAAP